MDEWGLGVCYYFYALGETITDIIAKQLGHYR
jgi:hypothetical protein